MKRPDEIYVLLGKISDGTILNESEYTKLETYIGVLENGLEKVSQAKETYSSTHASLQEWPPKTRHESNRA